MSMARTTPAQKPRGFSRSTRLVFGEGPGSGCTSTGSRMEVVTLLSIPCRRRIRALCHGFTGRRNLPRGPGLGVAVAVRVRAVTAQGRRVRRILTDLRTVLPVRDYAAT